MGLLKVKGTIDVDQFWPHGASDADTTKVKVNVKQGGFEYRPDGATAFKKTKAFENALVAGSQAKQPPIDEQGSITVRLQGIDAPELHYRPPRLDKKIHLTDAQRAAFKNLNQDYRQHFGETSTVRLGDLLRRTGNQMLRCEVITRVQHPTDVFDTYARFIGDILLSIDGKRVNINQWLVANGWAFPAFYVTMTADEITVLMRAYKAAKKSKVTAAGNYQDAVGEFDSSLRTRPEGSAFDASKDRGPVLLPKLFRRQCSWFARHQSDIFPGDFAVFLKAREKSDTFYETMDFLEHGQNAARPQFWSEHFLNNKLALRPADLVFIEAPSKLVDSNGHEILKW
jgi:endonuclease YncB( thermonuclease family)